MSSEYALLAKSIDVLERWSGRQTKATASKKLERGEAIQSLLQAVNETSGYLADCKNGNKPDRKREMEISLLWSKAAIKVRNVDRRLSTLAAMKSFGWADPKLWDDPKFKNLPLKLSVIRDQCIWLLERDG